MADWTRIEKRAPRWLLPVSVALLVWAVLNSVGGYVPHVLLAVIAGVSMYRARWTASPAGPASGKHSLENAKRVAVMLSRQNSLPGPLNDVLQKAVADHELITVLIFRAGFEATTRASLTREVDKRMQHALDLALEAPAHLGTSSDDALVQMEEYQLWLAKARKLLEVRVEVLGEEARSAEQELFAFVLSGRQARTLIES